MRAHRPYPWVLPAALLAAWIVARPATSRAQQPAAEPNTAQLAVRGENILSLTLEDAADRVIILTASPDAPTTVYRSASAAPRLSTQTIPLPADGGAVSLPPGKYRWNSVNVGEPNNPLRFTALNSREDWFTLAAGHTTSLVLGGPLRQRLGVSRSGPVLGLTCQLHGIGGESYRPAAQPTGQSSAQLQAPQLSVVKNGREVCTGSFRYG